MPKKLYIIFLFLFAFSFSALATHNRAGEIIYRHLGGFEYEITIITCTKTSVLADRPWLSINWGDIPAGALLDSLRRDTIVFMPEIDSQLNTYVGTHTYRGPGTYTLSVEDMNRNGMIQNIPQSVSVPFYIESVLVINPFAGSNGFNNSVQLLNPPKEQACINQPWYHNPGAYDPDGDSLHYSLVPSRGENGDIIPGYVYPQEVSPGNDTFTIDPNTGDVTWDAPQQAGEYNIAILIEEYRNGNFMGSVVRDMQINVITCNNQPPVIEAINDTCINAGETLNFTVSASDPDGDPIILSAVGGPFTNVENEAFFNPSSGSFYWTPECEEVRASSYQLLFKVEDMGNQISLTGIETVNVTVVAPPVENPTAEADGNSIILNWDQNPCVDALSEQEQDGISYKVYRRLNEFGFEPEHCELGVPGYTGYMQIGSTNGFDNTTFTDNSVFFGGNYCYMVVTCLSDGSVSYASEEFCAQIIKDVPVMTNVSVNITDDTDGENYIAWSPPTELDTVSFPPPYHYELYWGTGFGQANELIYTSPESSELFNGDTTFVHSGIDTRQVANAYRVSIFSDGELMAESSTASSVFINLVPDDNELTVNISDMTPWINNSYEIYKYNEDSDEFELLAEVNEPTYTDTGLINNVEYCYKVRTIGSYGVPFVIDPITNWSQESCAKPVDLTPPCAPELTLDADCEAEATYLTWTNPNETCPETDDVIGYNLYYTQFEGGEFQLLEQFSSADEIEYIFNMGNTIAGCFAVTALDSLMPGIDGELAQNESEFSNILCADNCPAYFLPNVFTPNNDGSNDVFQPFPYKFVKSVDCKIFNRWGTLVFETTNPDINWNGTNQDSGEVSSDGTYYYVVTVNTIRLEGIVPVEVTGSVQLINGAQPINGN